MKSESRQSMLVLLVITALVAAFWWPTLFDGKTLIHGDSIVHGLPLMDLHARALHGGASMLWSEQIYGGHPIFAEGQGAFAHPLNILFAAWVPPVYGHNLFHFVCMLLFAGGTYGLCRALGASVFAAGFGALVAAFAPVCTGAQQNLSIGGALAWVPWVLWAMEAWLRRPDILRAILFGTSCCLAILAGYPQLFHGVVIYMAVSLVVLPLQRGGRKQLAADWRRLLGTGAVAVLLCVGLAAVQLLPLLELTMHSHRRDGVGLIPFMPLDAFPYARGFLYSLTQGTEIPAGGYSGVVGSLLVCMAAALVLVTRTPARIKGHLLATLLLVQIGVGVASPLFIFLYSHNLLPGLNFFRTMSAYLSVAVVGFAVLAALGIDGFVSHLAASPRPNWRILGIAAIFAALSGAAAFWFYAPELPWWNMAAALIAMVAALLLMAWRHAVWIPLAVFFVLVSEVVLLHLREFDFADAALLAPPPSAQVLAHDKPLDDFRFMDRTMRPGYVFLSPRLPELDTMFPVLLASYPAMTNLLYGVASIHGATALPLKSRMLINDLMNEEVEGRGLAAPGQRAIDLLSVRYIAVNEPVEQSTFVLATVDRAGRAAFMENVAAKPRFQTYTRHVAVPSVESAVALLRQAREEALIIETGEPGLIATDETPNDSQALQFTLLEKSPTRYVFDVDAGKRGWLFVADANYPGWKATVDGIDSRVYSANVLGKAVMIAEGRHRVELYFESASFRIGLICTVVTMLAAAVVVLVALRRNHFERTRLLEGNA